MGFQAISDPVFDKASREIKERLDAMEEGKTAAMGVASMLSSFLVPSSMGYVPRKGSVSANTLEAGRLARSKIWKELKSRISPEETGIWNGIKRNIYNSLADDADKILTRKEALEQYKMAVKEVTSIPDLVVQNVKHVEKIKGSPLSKGSAWGQFDDTTGTLGLSSNFQKGTIAHEIGGHTGTQTARQLQISELSSPAIKKAVKKLTPEIKEALRNQSLMEDFDKAHLTVQKPQEGFMSRLPPLVQRFLGVDPESKITKFYDKNYSRWPSEIHAEGVARTLPGEVERLGVRPSYPEFLNMTRGPTEAGIRSMRKNFPEDYRYLKQMQDATFK